MSTRPAVAMSIVALAAGLALAGCDASHPDVDFAGGEVADARAAATSELTRALDDVAAGDDALTHVGPTAVRDECTAGQDNWKVSQPYAYTCELTVARAYTFPGDFRAGAAAVGEAMTPGGCPDGVTETEQVLREYYDANKGKTTTAFPEPYDGQYLPASAGGCVAAGERHAPDPADDEVSVSAAAWLRVPAHADDVRRSASQEWSRPCGTTEPWCRLTPLDLSSALGAARSGDDWAVVLTASTQYYRADWQ